MRISKTIFAILLLIFLTTHTVKEVNSSIGFTGWTSDTSLPYGLASHQSNLINDRIYIIGGGDSFVYRTDIYSSQINNDHTLAPWQKIGDLPLELIWHSSIYNNGNLYILGGVKKDPSVFNISSVDTVYRNIPDQNGFITSWTTEPNLPERLSRGGAFVYKNWIYYLGGLIRNSGNSNENVQSNVYKSSINSDGSLTNWNENSTLPQPLAEFAIFQWLNKVYITGGMQNNSSPSNNVYVGTIDENTGNISWALEANLPNGLRRPAFAQINDKLLLMGGYDGFSFTNTTLLSKVDDSGSLTGWSQVDPVMQHGNCCNSAVANDTSIYLTGGHDGSSYFTDVLRLDISPSTLPVPLLKQTDPVWKDLEYDTAHLWSLFPTIERWGCALTSASMILQYYHHNIFPDALNTWLKSQVDGYVGNGLLNWLAVSRYTKLHESNDSPSLEYKHYSADTNILNTEISQSRPPILNVPGHFVVATGQDNSDYFINDPAFSKTKLSQYPNFSGIHSYLPSQTDLSYIMLVGPPDLNIAAYNDQNNLVGEFYIQDPLTDDQNESSNSGNPKKIFLLSKPLNGEYKIILQDDISSNYNLESYLYNINGDVTKTVIPGLISPNESEEFTLHFNSQNGSNIVKKVTLASLKDDLNTAWLNGFINKKPVYELIKKAIDKADTFLKKGKTKQYMLALELIKKEVEVYTPRFISNDASGILVNDINDLLNP